MGRVSWIYVLLGIGLSSLCTGSEPSRGACNCGVFPVNSSTPIISHNLQVNVTCDEIGASTCQQLCVTLARGVQDQAPALLCSEMKTHAENLIVSIFVKACNETDWKFTGLQTTEPICCHEGNAVTCEPAIEPKV